MASRRTAHPWAFRTRFRREAFGWKSQPAITRVREAVAEIKKVSKSDPLHAAEGAVLFLERVSPALAHVDSSSGAVGTVVNRAIEELVAVIAAAPADERTREGWLERLYEARAADQIPYIELLADFWGELCVTKEIASRWVDREIGITRHALSRDLQMRGHYHGTIACLAALHRAERYAEIVDLLEVETFWHYKRWASGSPRRAAQRRPRASTDRAKTAPGEEPPTSCPWRRAPSPHLGGDDTAAPALSVAGSASRASRVANVMSRRAGCASRACPDLWGPRWAAAVATRPRSTSCT
jgi:hypothetical protein